MLTIITSILGIILFLIVLKVLFSLLKYTFCVGIFIIVIFLIVGFIGGLI
ncbi:hypothetical protein UT300003_32750 [Clostridium sardiniense]